MTTSRVTITLPAELRQAAQEVAEQAGLPFSTVVSDALAEWMRGKLLDAWIADYEAEFGEITEDELKAVAKETGVPYVPPRPGEPSRSAA